MSREKTVANSSWEGKHYSYFVNKECECYPCHDTVKPEEFNCLFCFCPLYPLKDKCGGNFKYSKEGVKDCSGCLIPHKKQNYGYIMGRFSEIVEVTRMMPEELEENQEK